MNRAQRKIHRNFFFQTWPGFFAMPVYLKSGIIAKQLYIRIHNYGCMFVMAMCKLFNFSNLYLFIALPRILYLYQNCKVKIQFCSDVFKSNVIRDLTVCARAYFSILIDSIQYKKPTLYLNYKSAKIRPFFLSEEY